MGDPVAIESLNVIGYADVVSSTVLPTIVPPVFALKTDTDQVLLPPYQLMGGWLCNAHRGTRAEADALEAGGGTDVAVRADFGAGAPSDVR